jgi:hypothetical protein
MRSEVCVTDDGVLLRRAENDVVTTVTAVRYGRVDPAATRLPRETRRVPAGDDTKYVPVPLVMD